MTTAGNSLGRIQIRDLSIRLGQGSEAFEAVRDLNLEARPGEFVCLLGPSGCGKSTLLGALAGHLRPSAGSVRVDGRSVEGPSPQRGMVFQQHTLFPWRRVRDNVAFGLKMQGLARAERNRRAMEMLGLVGLADFAGRWPGQLSGGMQQRVEIARVLVNRPRLLLLDEPLSALDAKLREEMQIELINLQKDVGITFVYVTHDQGEALALSHRIAVMNQGRVEQLDAPETIYSFPRSRFVADFIGQCNLLDATVEAVDGERVRIDLRGLGEVQALKSFDAQPGEACVLTLRPEKIRLAQSVTADSDEVHFRGRVAELLYLGDVTLYIVELENGERLETLLPNATPGRAKFFEVGDAVEAAWRFDAGHLVRA
ncbi:ABC transporter ATP-binding protein [Pseudomonas aeruginosa]